MTGPAEPEAAAPELRRRLRRWYASHRRDLPWRRTRDPYAILVSEVMLQQTTVRTAEPYYLKFIERFPNASALASATEDEVLSLWSGLGYYGRARNLRRAAQAIVSDHAGQVPSGESQVRALPGVGRYTAGAVLSIAYGARLPVLDGNVARVLARLFAVGGDPRRAPALGRLWEVARSLVPARGAGDHNQALMELGALVCTPSTPQCRRCPVSTQCAALAAGAVSRYPENAPRAPARSVHQAAALLRRGKRVLLERRAGDRIMAGLWELPTVELKAGQDPGAALGASLTERGLRGARTGRVLATLRHTIMNRRIILTVFEAEGPSGIPRGTYRWTDPQSPPAMTGATRKALRALGLIEG